MEILHIKYQDKFKQKILDGTKIHTIRTNKEDKLQEDFQFYHTTTNGSTFGRDTIKSIQEIYMTHNGRILQMSIDDKYIYHQEMMDLLWNDGFSNYKEFHDFFYPKIQKTKFKTYVAKLVHWTDKKY